MSKPLGRPFNYAKVLYVSALTSKLVKPIKGRKAPVTAAKLAMLLCKLAEMTPIERAKFVRQLRQHPIANKIWKQLD